LELRELVVPPDQSLDVLDMDLEVEFLQAVAGELSLDQNLDVEIEPSQSDSRPTGEISHLTENDTAVSSRFCIHFAEDS
jgi:hypothetical protein